MEEPVIIKELWLVNNLYIYATNIENAMEIYMQIQNEQITEMRLLKDKVYTL